MAKKKKYNDRSKKILRCHFWFWFWFYDYYNCCKISNETPQDERVEIGNCSTMVYQLDILCIRKGLWQKRQNNVRSKNTRMPGFSVYAY